MVREIERYSTALEQGGYTKAASEFRNLASRLASEEQLPEHLQDPEVFAHSMFLHHISGRFLFAKNQGLQLSEGAHIMLSILESRVNRVVTPEDISDYWVSGDQRPQLKTVYMWMHRLRDDFRSMGLDPRLIRNIRGNGYMLVDTERKKFVPQGSSETVYSHDSFSFYPQDQEILVEDQYLRLSRRETQILSLLCQHINRMVPIGEFSGIWTIEGQDFSESSLGNYINQLRRKLGGENGEVTGRKGRKRLLQGSFREGYMMLVGKFKSADSTDPS